MVTMIRSDLDFILAQIKIAEADARGEQLLGTYIPNSELPWGLRRVDGSNNNLLPGQGDFGSANQPFPTAVEPNFINETDDGMAFGPPIFSSPGVLLSIPGVNGPGTGVPLGYVPGPGGNFLSNNDYGIHATNTSVDPRAIQPGDVVDADPRIISNLIVDQTLKNPAIVFKSLQVAGADDPFAAMLAINSLVADVTLARAAVVSAQAALAAAQAANAPNQATIDAYLSAVAISSTLAGLAADLQARITALVAEFATGGATADAADLAALADAIAVVNTLVTQAQAVLDILTAPGISAAPADTDAVQDLIDTVEGIGDGLGLINLADGTVDALDNLLAVGADASDNGLATQAAAVDASLDSSLAGLSADVAAAVAALADAQADVTEAETVLAETIEDHGLLTSPSLTGDILKTTLVVENVAPDEGLSAPFNGWMTFF
jgi:hypothetical protein